MYMHVHFFDNNLDFFIIIFSNSTVHIAYILCLRFECRCDRPLLTCKFNKNYQGALISTYFVPQLGLTLLSFFLNSCLYYNKCDNHFFFTAAFYMLILQVLCRKIACS